MQSASQFVIIKSTQFTLSLITGSYYTQGFVTTYLKILYDQHITAAGAYRH